MYHISASFKIWFKNFPKMTE